MAIDSGRADAVRAILATYASAQPNQHARGRTWYPLAAELCASIAADVVDVRQSIGAAAALSPRMRWDRNLPATSELVAASARGEDMPLVGIHRNCAKAWRILAGDDPLDVLGGPKTRAFYAAIGGDVDAVTVDVWASRVAQVPPPTSAKRYDAIAAAYLVAADKLGLPPRDLQAITWLAAREHAKHPNQLILDIDV